MGVVEGIWRGVGECINILYSELVLDTDLVIQLGKMAETA
jgi:hypothetical protein